MDIKMNNGMGRHVGDTETYVEHSGLPRRMIPIRNPNMGYSNPPPQSRYGTSTRLTENGLNGSNVSMDNSFNPTGLVNRALGYGQQNMGGGYTIRRSFNDYGMPMNSMGMNGLGNEYNFRMKMGRQVEKSRGLRHFSQKVCEKVREKVQTNYNEVADELVNEYFDSLPEPQTNMEKQQYETKNIRRRVYDALNVLMAMNIIEKEKKEIHWVGLPTSSLAECKRLDEEKQQRQERLRQKTEQLQDLIIQLVTYKSLVQKNREREREMGRANEASLLYLPYIIVSTDKKTMVDCCISPDKSEYWFNFDHHFEIHDDIEVLKLMGLAYGLDCSKVSDENILHIKGCLPAALRDYVDQIIEGQLAGGVISKSGKGSQTVTISTNQQERKPALLKYGAQQESLVPSSQQHALHQPPLPSLTNRNSMGYAGGITHQNQSGRIIGQPNAPMARFTVIPRSINTSGRYSMPQQQQHQYAPSQQYVYTRNGGGGNIPLSQQRQYIMQHHDSPAPSHRIPQQNRQYSQYQSQNQSQYQGIGAHHGASGHIVGGVEDDYLEAEEIYEEEENLDYN